MTIRVDNLTRAWELSIQSLKNTPVIPSRNGPMLEELGASFMLTDLQAPFVFNSRRKPSPIYGFAEFLWYLSGNSNGKMICAYAPSYSRFLNENMIAEGAYGPSIMDSLLSISVELKNSENSRRAVIPLFSMKNLFRLNVNPPVKDTPCTLSLQFLLRDGYLNCITTMRSNDAWLGMPYDVFCFSLITKIVSSHIGALEGALIHQVGSYHLYEKDAHKFEPSTEEDYQRVIDFKPHSKDPIELIPEALRYEEDIRLGRTQIHNDLYEEIADHFGPKSILCNALIFCSFQFKKPKFNELVGLTRYVDESLLLSLFITP